MSYQPHLSPEAALSRISGSSEMATHIREKDWSRTSLGPIESWSETLVISVNFMLAFPFAFAIYWGESLILLYNDEYLPLLDAKHPAALGRTAEEVWAEAWDAVRQPMMAALSEGRSRKEHEALIPIMIDGIMTDRWFTYSSHPIRDAGKIVGVGNSVQDNTSAVLARKAVSDSEARLSQVLNATTDAVVSVNREWKFTYLNAPAIATYAAGRDLLGKKLWEEFPDAVYEGSPYVEHYERAMYEGKAGTFEAYYPDPLNIWIRLSAFPTTDGIVTFSRDITEEKRAVAALMQTEKLAAVGRLAASIAHEINNPLESVTNLLYIARNCTDLKEVQTYLDLADEELRRVAVIANQTLGFHKQSSRPREISCLDLFSSVLNMYRSKLRNSGIEVEKRKRANKPVMIYEGDIRQVLANVIGNAIDAMPSGGRLIVRSRESENRQTCAKGLRLTVADTGTGIAKDKLTKVFEAFYTTKGIAGTGLGLWISKDIMQRHGGKISIRSSQHEGHRGTVVTLFLPFNNPVAATA